MSTAAERAQRYYEGIDLGGSLYDADADAVNIHGHLLEPERHRTTGPSDTKGPYSRPNDTEGQHSGPSDTEGQHFGPSDTKGQHSGPSDMEGQYSGPSDTEVSEQDGRSGRPMRRRQVRFTLPRQPRPEGDSR